MTRRQLLSIAAMLAATATGGCLRPSSGGDDSGQITLRFWNGFTGPDGRTMLAIIRAFNASQSDVRVIMQRMEWGSYYNKLFVAGLGGRAPDVFVVHTDFMTRFVNAGFARDVADLLAPGRIDPTDFEPHVLAAVTFNGKPFAVPLDLHPLGLYYNRKIFAQAGLTEPPTARDAFLRIAKLLRRDEGGRTAQWGFVYTWLRTNAYAITHQFPGGGYVTPAGELSIVSDANIAALDFAGSLVRDGLAPSPENINAFLGFRQGRVGMLMEGLYMLPELQRQTDLDFAAAPVPMLGTQRATWVNSHNLALRADLQGRRLAAAQRFIEYLSANTLDWAIGGQVPARLSLRTTDRFRAMPAQWAFAQQTGYGVYLPRLAYIAEFLSEYDLCVERVLRGRMNARQALTLMNENVQRVRDRQAAEVAHA
jgi:multiple sugar transport system substrate-binding protein